MPFLASAHHNVGVLGLDNSWQPSWLLRPRSCSPSHNRSASPWLLPRHTPTASLRSRLRLLLHLLQSRSMRQPRRQSSPRSPLLRRRRTPRGPMTTPGRSPKRPTATALGSQTSSTSTTTCSPAAPTPTPPPHQRTTL